MNYIKEERLEDLVREALEEDIGKKDITTELLIPKNKAVKAIILAKEECVVCGINIAALVFKALDKKIKFKSHLRDGAKVKKGKVIASVSGNARSILSAERTALNFITFLSGIATKTRKFVEVVKPYNVKILDTRKTIPGWRLLQKYAVRVGGGFNHRLSLEEMIMVKDNHLAALCAVRYAPCVKEIIEQVKKSKYRNRKIEIEVTNLKEFQEALKASPDIIMLDNMKIKDIKRAAIIKRKTHNAKRITLLEASGGITLKRIRKIASTGVDLISIGEMTHSVDSVDISLEII